MVAHLPKGVHPSCLTVDINQISRLYPPHLSPLDSCYPSHPAAIASTENADMTSSLPAPSPDGVNGSAVAPDPVPVPSLQNSNTPLPHFCSRQRRGNVARLP